jgi:crotonobetainyl-CoA:carnitine CoA-transferase CaiB-like acyl-CoA transferase
VPGPLAGIRVVDFSRVLAGPHCGQTLLELGAEVVKIEPPTGDLSREAFPREGEISGYYAQQNAGKRNVSIDLNVAGSREVALRLCDDADVVLESFRAGTLAAFGLGYDDVAARNPRVVYASITGYGQHGPWRARPAYAPTIQAETGITSITAAQFGQQRTDSLSHADVYTALHATIAILAALNHRARTGQGQYVDIAMAAVMLDVNERVHVDLSGADLGAEQPILGAADAAFFAGPDGSTIVLPMSLIGSVTFPRYAAAMRQPDLLDDPRFSTPEVRQRNLEALRAVIQDWIWTFDDMASLDAQLDDAKIPTGRVREVADLAATEWASAWGATRTVPDRNGGEFTVPGIPWHFSRDDRVPAERTPARRGEHNDEVLHELGYDDAEVADLWHRGALVHGA